MLGFTKQDDAGIGSKSLIGGLNFDAAVEVGFKKINLYCTHRVILSVLTLAAATPRFYPSRA